MYEIGKLSGTHRRLAGSHKYKLHLTGYISLLFIKHIILQLLLQHHTYHQFF